MRPGADLLEPTRRIVRRWAGAGILALVVHAGGAALALLHLQPEAEPEPFAGLVTIELAPLPAAAPRDTPDLAHGPLTQEAAAGQPAARQAERETQTEQPRLEPSPLAPDPEVQAPIPRPDQETKPQDTSEVAQPQEPAPAAAAAQATAPPRVEARPAPPAAAPSAGAGASTARVLASWQRSLLSHLNRHKRYPQGARARGLQGEVSVEFTLDRAGRVVRSLVVKSSGSSLLDQEALAVLQRASPLPAPPDQLAGNTFDLALPIQFRIR
jgi:protein TonB